MPEGCTLANNEISHTLSPRMRSHVDYIAFANSYRFVNIVLEALRICLSQYHGGRGMDPGLQH
ncbi:hypothetical protein BAUCODRAFT_34350 [Baudoinia panamericana UAMH 10762]|uniref:Uncharacterized protein n=1 Tax=Baudoinia panamericana (strain UAMH 10762) TaxID=717646 RepID=M2N938_BAUPA|nr:uncharacterized protein BAUCODRAFT_34350 [Baudoinia panamericana UAMH 10762]EMC95599.1 hypothetical protein BAUCODRAFT_34350 [Baudoinia panamericana UAMH 10762]